MKRHLYLFIMAYLVVCSHVASAQKTIWGITNDNASGSVYHVNAQSLQATKAFVSDPASPAGANPQFLIQAANGEVFGISSTSESPSNGVVFRLAKSGLKRVYTLPFQASGNASLVEGSDGYLYGAAGSPGGNFQVFKVRPHGTSFQNKTVTVANFQPSGVLTNTSEGIIVGVSETGGNHGAGFIYKLESNLMVKPIFHFNTTNGKRPLGRLVQGADGTLYGITNAGGTNNYGTIFKIKVDGSQFAVLHHFNNTLGSYPSAGPAIAADGTIYGTTRKGGQYSKGTIFKISSSGQGFSVLYHFNGNGGANPEVDLIIDSSGILYGTADGGSNGFGFAYSFVPATKVLTKLREFSNERAAGNLLVTENPFETSIILLSPADNSSNAPVKGTFKSREWPGTLSYTLELSPNADFSNAQVFSSASYQFTVNTNLSFGTKYYARVKSSVWPAYGTVTSFTTRAAEDYSFVVKPVDGASGVDSRSCTVVAAEVPGASYYKVQLSTTADFSAEVFMDSSVLENERTFKFKNLKFGTRYYARSASDKSGFGKVTSFTTAPGANIAVVEPANGATDVNFRVMKVQVDKSIAGSSTLIAISTNQNFPSGSIIRSSLLPGQTEFVVRNLQPSTTYYVRAWQEGSTAYGPTTTFTTRDEIPARRLWGVTTRGGSGGLGSIFSFSIDSMTFTKHYDYSHPDYDFIYLDGEIVEGPSGFYTLSISDGTGEGEILSFSPQSGVSILDYYGVHDGSLTLGSDNYLYVINDWINYFQGGIFRLHSSGDDEFSLDDIIHRFNRRHGINPRKMLYERADGYLYGVAPYEGENDHGTIYRLQMDGSGFQVIYHFEGTDGSAPSSALIEGEDGFLYGVTELGGTNNAGVLYKILPSGDGYTVLHNFGGSTGARPFGTLLLHNGKLYGTASDGGTSNKGVVFSINVNGSGFTKLLEFNGTNGSNPVAGLTLGADGYLYGNTTQGGTSNLGVIYRVHPSTLQSQVLHSFTPAQGGSPNGRMIESDDYFFGTPSNARVLLASNDDTNEAEVLYYPNPFTSSFQAELRTSTAEPIQYTLSDMSGNTVETAQAVNGSVSMGERLPKGLYVLKIRQGNNTSTFRVVKN